MGVVLKCPGSLAPAQHTSEGYSTSAPRGPHWAWPQVPIKGASSLTCPLVGVLPSPSCFPTPSLCFLRLSPESATCTRGVAAAVHSPWVLPCAHLLSAHPPVASICIVLREFELVFPLVVGVKQASSDGEFVLPSFPPGSHHPTLGKRCCMDTPVPWSPR